MFNPVLVGTLRARRRLYCCCAFTAVSEHSDRKSQTPRLRVTRLSAFGLVFSSMTHQYDSVCVCVCSQKFAHYGWLPAACWFLGKLAVTSTPPIDFQRLLSSRFQALLTDMYQVTMSYAYWRAGRQDEHVRASAHASSAARRNCS